MNHARSLATCASMALLTGAALLHPAALPPLKKAAKARGAHPAAAAARTGPELAGATGLAVVPASFTLDGPRATEHLLVTAAFKDGTFRDVTDQVTFSLGNPPAVRSAPPSPFRGRMAARGRRRAGAACLSPGPDHRPECRGPRRDAVRE